jgi:hypothetical protein
MELIGVYIVKLNQRVRVQSVRSMEEDESM